MMMLALLNVVTYFIGVHSGKSKAYYFMAAVLHEIAPEEMESIRTKIDKIDVMKFAIEHTKQARAEKRSQQ